MDERFKQLEARYGSKVNVARALAVDRRSYYNYRAGRMPLRISLMIDLLLGNGIPQPSGRKSER
jgi:hypothetical protein